MDITTSKLNDNPKYVLIKYDELMYFAEWVSINKYKFDGISIWRKYYKNGEVFYTTKQVVDQYLKENK